MIYLKIISPSYAIEYSKFQKKAIKMLFYIFPIANPDFEHKINQVKFWLLEFEDDMSIPIREVGLDHELKVIAKMPYRENLGYWTDNTIKYKFFVEKFNTSKISKYDFDNAWESLEIPTTPLSQV